MMALRTIKLVESKCDQMALKLSHRATLALRSCTGSHRLRNVVSIEQHQLLMEIYFSLLYKYKKLEKIKFELRILDDQSLHRFIECTFNRLNDSIAKPKYHRIARLTKYLKCVNQFALQFRLVQLLHFDYNSQLHDQLIQPLFLLWLRQHRGATNFNELLMKLMANAVDKNQKYLCCQIIHESVSICSINFLQF